MKELGIPFDEVVIPLDQPDTARRILQHSPAGRVPILIDGDIRVWESLAIFEYVAERVRGRRLASGPQGEGAGALDQRRDALPGFTALRTACPMNLGKKFAARDRGRSRREGCRADRGDLARRARPLRRGRTVPVRRLHGRGCDVCPGRHPPRHLLAAGRSRGPRLYGRDPVASGLPGMAAGRAQGDLESSRRRGRRAADRGLPAGGLHPKREFEPR